MNQPLYNTGMPHYPYMQTPCVPSYLSYMSPMMQPFVHPHQLLIKVRPWVEYGLREAQTTGFRHAMTQVTLITYLMGMGYDQHTAHRLVESWEIDEKFPGE